MAGDAGIGAHVEVAQIAHAGGHPRVVIPVGARVSAQPASGGAMAAFAGNAFVRMRGSGEPAGRDGLEGRMTRGAARARLCRRYSEALGDSLRARIEQDGMRLGVKVLLAPGDVLAALWAGAAMAARRFAADRSDKRTAAFTGLPWLSCAKTCDTRGKEEADTGDFGRHAKSFTPAFCKMRLQSECAFSGPPLRRQHEGENHVAINTGLRPGVVIPT